MKNIEKHWNTYYSKSQKNIPSNFAKYIFEWIKKNKLYSSSKKILDIACGNGRDTIFFKKKLIATGLDFSKTVIEKNINNFPDIKFINQDICNKNFSLNQKYEFLYARFFLHAITRQQQKIFFANIKKISKKNSYLFLEFRTIKDPLYKKGKKLSTYERYYGHYRRFIDPDVFINEINKFDLTIVYLKKSNKFAIHDKDTPHICRIIIKL